MSYDSVIKDTRTRMEKALAHTQDMLRGIRTGRASASLVDSVRVDYYGSMTPLSQIAQISVPEPRTLVIKPFDAGSLKDIEKAVLKSDLGISPENDGKVVRLNLPPLSGDQRKKYAAKAKELAEEGRVALRNLRRDGNKEADGMLKSKDITEDDNKGLHGEIQDVLKEFEGKVAKIYDKKHHEIMEL